jgi:hypothetical protein
MLPSPHLVGLGASRELHQARYAFSTWPKPNGQGHELGELRIEIPHVRKASMPFVSKLFPKW